MMENNVVLPAPLGPDQRDAVAVIHRERGVFKQHAPAKRHFQISNCQH